MSARIEPQQSISAAWLQTVEFVNAQPEGRAVNVMTTILDPMGPEDPVTRSILDEYLDQGDRGSTHIQSVETVAGTIFSPEYRSPGFDWSPELAGTTQEAELDQAAKRFYDSYLKILPLLRQVPANKRGTYFGRLISWPGKEAGGPNQLAKQIATLRRLRTGNVSVWNALDIAVGGEALESRSLNGLQAHSATDNSRYGFPCLVHIDLSLFQGKLNLQAVYRHQYLMTKSYGNSLGLSRVLDFLCHQTGFPPGELVIVAGMSDAEHKGWKKSTVDEVLLRVGQLS